MAYTATALEAGLDTNLTLPVPLTILHNATSPHAFASFLAAASTLRWRARVGALGASGGAAAAAAAAAAGAGAGAGAAAGAAAAEGRAVGAAVNFY